MSQIATSTQPQPRVAPALTAEQLAQLTNMALGPGADPCTLLEKIDDTPYADMKCLLEGTVTASEYTQREKRKQAAMRRDMEDLQDASMEVMGALAEAHAKSRSLVSENEAMIAFLRGRRAVLTKDEQVAELKGYLAEPLPQPLSEQLLGVAPSAGDLLQDFGG